MEYEQMNLKGSAIKKNYMRNSASSSCKNLKEIRKAAKILDIKQ
jgi:hypothetical protein